MERNVAKNIVDLIRFWEEDVKFEIEVDEEGEQVAYYADEYSFKGIDIDFQLNLPFTNEIIRQMDDAVSQNIGTLTFDNCTFLDKFYIGNSETNIEFVNNCRFESVIRCWGIKNNLIFENCTIKRLNFENSTFGSKDSASGKVRFRKCNFHEVNFCNTTFKQLADFWNCTFHKEVIFYKTDFLGTVVFSAATFKEDALFTYSLINDKIIFRGTKFEKGLDLSLAIITGDVNLFDINLTDFQHSEPKNNDEYQSDVSKKGNIPLKNKRETYRLLKKYFEGQSDNIKGLDFKFLERSAQSKELQNELLRGGKFSNEHWRSFIYSKLSAFLNIIIHFLNLFSNWYGKSYFAGIIFTVVVGFLFFNLSLLGTSKYIYDAYEGGILTIIKGNTAHFLSFLNPTHKFNYLGLDFVDTYTSNKWFYIWDFIGRIFVGFGIYQTIQAFRKYR